MVLGRRSARRGLLVVVALALGACSSSSAPATGDGTVAASSPPTLVTVRPTVPTTNSLPSSPPTAPPTIVTVPPTTVLPIQPSSSSPAAAESTLCDEGEHTGADGPVTIEIWSYLRDRAGDTLADEVAAFVGARPDVTVEIVQFDGAEQALTTWRAAEPSERPALLLLSEDFVGELRGEPGTVPMGDCLDIDGPLVPSIEATFTVDGSLQAAPFGVSTPLVFFDRAAFAAAGLDPAAPLRSLDDLRDALDALATTGVRPAGLAVETGPYSGGVWYVEQWLAQVGLPSLVPANGREGAVTSTAWASDEAIAGLEVLRGLVVNGRVLRTEDSTFADLVAIGTGQVAMSVHTSGSLGDVIDAIDGGGFPGVELGVGPLFGPGTGALVGGSAWWAASGGTVEAQRAAWSLVRHLAAAPQQAALAIDTGYVPIRAASLDEPVFLAALAEHPEWRVGFDQLAGVEVTDARLAPVSSVRAELRAILAAAVRAVVFDGAAPRATMEAAVAEAEAVLSAAP